jgi:hypothetical protein
MLISNLVNKFKKIFTQINYDPPNFMDTSKY